MYVSYPEKHSIKVYNGKDTSLLEFYYDIVIAELTSFVYDINICLNKEVLLIWDSKYDLIYLERLFDWW